MTKKSDPSDHDAPGGSAFKDNVKDSAQQIWLAGLGAFTKAQAEGSKVFDALVKEGAAMQHKTQAAAEEKLTEASQKMSSLASDFGARASEFQNKASGQWDKLETIFEDRVAKALHRLGVPSAQDIEALSRRVDELSQAAQKPAAKAPVRRAARKTATMPASTTAKKPAVKRKP